VLIVRVLIIAVLSIIFVQDLLSRSVQWILFLCLFSCLLILRVMEHATIKEISASLGINFAFLAMQLLAVTIYFSIKNKGWINITKALLGWGDILFLLCLTVCFSILNYLFFYILSLLASLIIWIILRSLNLIKDRHIPLAGFQAMLLILLFIAVWWIKPLNLNSDNGLFQFFSDGHI